MCVSVQRACPSSSHVAQVCIYTLHGPVPSPDASACPSQALCSVLGS